MIKTHIIFLILFLFVSSATVNAQTTIYVDADAIAGANDGSSWGDAYTELADALKWAREQWDAETAGWDADNPLSIWVAGGTYLPLYAAADGQYTADGGRDNAFVMVEFVNVYGGFAGSEDPAGFDLSNRDFVTNETILTGDLDGDDEVTGTGENLAFANNGENAYHVVIGAFADAATTARLNGFTVTGGNADDTRSPNTITINGQSVFFDSGGGISVWSGSFDIDNNLIRHNSAENAGGGMFNSNSSPILTNVTFSDNSAIRGGGMYILNSSPILSNVNFSGNSANLDGGGMRNRNSSPTLTNVIFSGNSASSGGGMANDTSSSPTLTNVILWDNTANTWPEILNISTTTTISHSLIAGSGGSGSWNSAFGTDGGSNIDADPLFADPNNGDYSLTNTSQAINAGDNQAYTDAGGDLINDKDLAGNDRVFNLAGGGVIDMGAYEFQGEPETDLVLTIDEGWRMLSTPVAGQTYAQMLAPLWTQGAGDGDYTGGTPNVYRWPVTGEGSGSELWEPLENLDTPVGAGNGFLMYVFADDVYGELEEEPFPKQLLFTGPFNSGDVSPDLNDNSEGWTLVGNPYGQPILFSRLERTEVQDAAYVYDPNATDVETTGPVNGNGGAWRTTVSGLYGDLTDGIIAPGQGFFVQTASEAANPSLTFSPEAQTSGGDFYGKEASPRDFVRLEVEGESLINSVWIRFSGAGDLQSTGGEAVKLQSLSADYVMLAARKADGALKDIAHYPLDAESLEMPLALETTRSGMFTIRATDLDLPAGMELYLHDRQSGEYMPIDDEDFDYSFSLQSAVSVKESEISGQPLSIKGAPEKARASESDRFVITTSQGKMQAELPGQVALQQNYPNPFNPATMISYQLPEQSVVRLEVYDMTGRQVASLVDGQVSAGSHTVRFDASGLSSGVYVYRLQAGGAIFTRQLTLIK